MVLTDRQRKDLHWAIYDYLRDHCPEAAAALAAKDPECAVQADDKKKGLLEKKWTAIPRLQKKVLELERAAAHNQTIHGHRRNNHAANGESHSTSLSSSSSKRMLPRFPCAHTLQGHAAVVTCVEVHPVYTIVASGSEDGTLKIWDHESGEYLKTLKGHTNTVTSLSFSPTGSHLVSSSTDLSIKLWDMTTHRCVRTLRGHDHTISAVRFMPPQQQSSGTTLTLSSMAPADGSGGSGVDPDVAGSSFILSCSRDRTAKIWDVATGFCEATISDHSDWVRCCAVTSTAFCTSGNDTVIYVYDAVAATKGGTSGKIQKLQELRGHEHVVESVAFGPTDDDVVSGGRDRTVRLWKAGQCLFVFEAHENWVRSVIWHPSSQNYILSAGEDKSIKVLDIRAQRCLRSLDHAHPHFVTALSMHAKLPILVSASVDTTLKCWNLD